MSEHEGFGVPLVEAMWFDIPVLAYSSSAVPETLGEAGLMFNNKNDWFRLQPLLNCLCEMKYFEQKLLTHSAGGEKSLHK
jgi:glycosyltransferase involved in cell wall biosynthesis